MPALIESEHPACAHLIREYKKCSATASLFAKIVYGECTAEKYRLDDCFKEQKVKRSKANLARSKVLRAQLQEARRREYAAKQRERSAAHESSRASS